jgi:hypothetical protein
MNNWRSGFFGVNDHEADWEQVFIFLAESDQGEPQPHWVAYASHDFKGDDLRRRWDDSGLLREGNHPVVFVGAGSHASYFEQGEYLMGSEPEFLQPLKGALSWLRKFWSETLGMGGEAPSLERVRAMLSVPFIDYARGDGRRIGPDQEENWTPVIISDEDAWVDKFRGLWGLDTRDPFGGERAPAGPKYNRDGSVRQSWFDPIGWAGLAKAFPPDQLPGEIDERLLSLQAEIEELTAAIDGEMENLRRQALDVEALRITEYFSSLHGKKIEDLKIAERSFQDLHTRRSELIELHRAFESYRMRLRRGDIGPPTAHLRHVHHPEPSLPPQHRLVEIWGALSNAVILIGIVLLLFFRPANWPIWLVVLGVLIAGIEALMHASLIDFMLNIIIVLAVIAGIILLIEFWDWILILALIGMVVFLIRGNLQEIRR